MLKKLARYILRKQIDELLDYSKHSFQDGFIQGRKQDKFR